MGYRASIIACAALDRTEFLRLAGFTGTGEPDAFNETDFSGVVHGKYFLLWQNWREQMLNEHDYFRLSKSVALPTCEFSETSMFSATCAWRNGHPIWSVIHHGDQDVLSLSVEGDPPPALEQIKSEVFQQQNSAGGGGIDHVFEIPIRLFDALADFTYNMHQLPFESFIRKFE